MMRFAGTLNRSQALLVLRRVDYFRLLTQLGQDWEDNAKYVRPHQLMYDEISNFGMW